MDSIQFQNEKEKIIVVCLLPSQKTKLALANSTWLSWKWTSRKCTKKRDARAVLLL